MRRLHGAFLQLGIAAAVCVSTAMATYADEKKDSAQEFVKASDLTDIRSPGSQPFELDAKVDIWGVSGKLIPGSYKLVWVSPSEWREELSFSGYSRVRVGGNERYWQQRSLDYEPMQINELSEAIDFASALRGEKTPGKLKSRKESEVVLDCVESANGLRREYCFDPSEGVLVLEKIWGGSIAESYDFRYSNFQGFGQRRYPGTVQVMAGRNPIADFTVARLVSIEKTGSSDFIPPAGASLWLTCSNPQKPHLISQVNAVYPPSERRAHSSGTVEIYVLVASDGSVQNLKVLEAPSPALADAAVAAVRQWRYEPKRCGDTPTPTETFITVVFTLSPN
jgi:TonB family protein